MKKIDENHSFNIHIATMVGVNKAILLKELYGWCSMNRMNEKNIHAGRAWTYNSVKAYSEKFPYMTERSIARWFDELERDGWIESGNYNEKQFDRTKWYSIDFKKYDDAILSICQNGECNSQNGERICQDGEPYHLLPSLTNTISINPDGEKKELSFDQVAKLMEEYVTVGDGKGQWEAMCQAQGFTGKPITVFMNWAGKASPYQLKNWKTEIPRLQSWMRNEARADYVTKKRTERNGGNVQPQKAIQSETYFVAPKRKAQ